MNPIVVTILALVTLERLAELAWSRSNTRRLLVIGGREFGSGHYAAMVGLHAAWLCGLWILGWDAAIEPVFLFVFAFAQVGRGWVLWTLGRRWTTRIVVVPGRPFINRGPYRFMRHPNYLVVAIEIAALPLALGLVWYAAVFSVLNAAILAVRIAAENRALDAAAIVPATVRQSGR